VKGIERSFFTPSPFFENWIQLHQAHSFCW